jgi:hypothetical protein
LPEQKIKLMKNQKKSTNAKLFLKKETITVLNKEQQSKLFGGETPVGGGTAGIKSKTSHQLGGE